MTPSTTHRHFPDHTVESAPAEARPTLQRVRRRFGGTLPPAVARMAGSPELLATFLNASAVFDGCSLSPLQRETLVMTVAVRNGCHVCVQLHTPLLRGAGADEATVAALHAGEPVPADDLRALQEFTTGVLDTAGAVGRPAIDAFLGNGYTAQQALEVVLGIGTYTLSTLANRMTEAPVAAGSLA